jgi:hypothetical protein
MPALTSLGMAGNHVVMSTVCRGCGSTDGEHRPDCTAHPSPLLCADCDEIRLPSEPKTPPWRYDPRTHTYHCPTHQKGTTP